MIENLQLLIIKIIEELSTSSTHQGNTNMMIINMEIDTFKGDSLEYHYFMSVFTEAVGNKVNDPRSRLVRLLKFTEAETVENIKHCIQ